MNLPDVGSVVCSCHGSRWVSDLGRGCLLRPLYMNQAEAGDFRPLHRNNHNLPAQ